MDQINLFVSLFQMGYIGLPLLTCYSTETLRGDQSYCFSYLSKVLATSKPDKLGGPNKILGSTPWSWSWSWSSCHKAAHKRGTCAKMRVPGFVIILCFLQAPIIFHYFHFLVSFVYLKVIITDKMNAPFIPFASFSR